MRRVFIILSSFLLISLNGYSQLRLGLNIGVMNSGTSSVMAMSVPDDIPYRQVADNEFGRIFISAHLDLSLFEKPLWLRQEVAYYHSYRTFNLIIPPNDLDVYLSTAFRTLNYRAVLRILTKKRFSLFVGPSLDFNFEIEDGDDTFGFENDYPEAGEFARAVLDSYNLVILYGDIEGQFTFNRFRLSANYKIGLTSPTGKFDYKGINQGVRSNSHQWLFRLGYELWVK